MLFSKCLRAKLYCKMNGHFDPQGCQTLLLKESELFFYLWAPGLIGQSRNSGSILFTFFIVNNTCTFLTVQFM